MDPTAELSVNEDSSDSDMDLATDMLQESMPSTQLRKMKGIARPGKLCLAIYFNPATPGVKMQHVAQPRKIL